ncbi:catechol-2,3-dioxygenase [Paenibacillus shirakamiensis]|uniref:Catechol-2,3-dioxygenase n=1 Tax=Paenibacillus shirakamiensis TaxID=1265935 RepID=A0ABS4JFQ2_9BACL|nr:VOC family protein [Paenibacillus shirakamiensis]MBP1999900.1 catechol-2,3-dioxygenase [Paenibacillus shirakamiensis]
MRITELTLQTHQLCEIQDFYEKVLELAVLEQSETQFTLQVGGSKITFISENSAEKAYYHVAITIPTNRFHAAKQWIKDRGISLIMQEGEDEFTFEDWNASALYFYDPDDNLIEFIAHHSLDNAVVEPFGSTLLLRVSEVGLPVDHVPEVVKMLKDSHSLSLWRGNGEQFAALGDAEGLLIVVDSARPWFPDGRAPGIFPTSVTIEKGIREPAMISIQDENYVIKFR